MYSDPRSMGDAAEAEKKAKRQAEMAERLKKQQEEESRRKTENKKRELKRRIQSMNLDLTTVDTRIGVVKSALKVFESEARRETAHSEKAEREIASMKRDLLQKRGAVRKLEKDIENKINHEKLRGGGSKKRKYEDRKRALEKLLDEKSSIEHKMARTENELRSVR